MFFSVVVLQGGSPIMMRLGGGREHHLVATRMKRICLGTGITWSWGRQKCRMDERCPPTCRMHGNEGGGHVWRTHLVTTALVRCEPGCRIAPWLPQGVADAVFKCTCPMLPSRCATPIAVPASE